MNENQTQQNIHNPARQSDETFEAYKVRRKASNEAVKENSQIGKGGYNTRKANRDEASSKGHMKYLAGSYGRGLRNWITQKQQSKAADKE